MSTMLKTRPKILFFEGPQGVKAGYRAMFNAVMKSAGLTLGDLFQINLHKIAGDTQPLVRWVRRGKKLVPSVLKDRQDFVARGVHEYTKRFNPDVIVCNDLASLYLFSGGNQSIAQCRGGVYRYYFGDRIIPVFVVDDIERCVDTNHGKWVAIHDWRKIARWISGTQATEPQFQYAVAHTREDLAKIEADLVTAFSVTTDIETISDWISCIGYTGVWLDGSIRTYVIPFFNPHKPEGAHWGDVETEVFAWDTVRRIHASAPIKILQNGAAYDSAFFVKYRVPLYNYFIDTMHMWHCLYAELPKRIDFIASIVVDHYTFWKEESKGDKDQTGRFSGAGLERHWRYCALDNYFTTLAAFFLIRVVPATSWAATNYAGQFRRQLGPGLAMQCRGILIDFGRRKKLRDEWDGKLAASLHKLRVMVDNPDFNPASPDQVAQLFYVILGAQKVKVRGVEGGTDEYSLKMISEQHTIIKMYVDAILEFREAAQLIKMYFKVLVRRNRFHYSMLMAGTETSRAASGKFMWEGGNAQNLPEFFRDIFIADPGYLFFDIDLEQSDARYVAYESQDLRYIETVESGKDTHCVHAAHFFKEDYGHILAQVRAEVPKYAHKVTGIRALTKRIVHGSNFQMAANTLFTIMGRDAAIAAATAIGYKEAWKLSNKQLIKVCEVFLEDYHVLYPRLRPWYKEIEASLAKYHRLTTAFGWTRTFFGKSDDPRVQREATAFYGQGDTAGNINRAIDCIYWGREGVPSIEERGAFLLLQVHDSLFGLVREDRVELCREIQDYLELPVTIHGRSMRVPSATTVGKRWGKGMQKWSVSNMPRLVS